MTISDITWHEDMENCPNGETVLIRDDDGEFRLIEAGENDTPWSHYYPMRGPKVAGVGYPEAWARVA